MRSIVALPTRILAVGTLVAMLGFCSPVADGAAQRRGPQAGHATLGYNRAHRFFYGTARMPPNADGLGDAACLAGNRHFLDGPRILRIYRVRPGPDRAVSPDIAAGATPENGTLSWKFERRHVPSGRYYVVFEAKIRSAPYTPSECPGFRSRPVVLPRPQNSARSPRSGRPHRHRH